MLLAKLMLVLTLMQMLIAQQIQMIVIHTAIIQIITVDNYL